MRVSLLPIFAFSLIVAAHVQVPSAQADVVVGTTGLGYVVFISVPEAAPVTWPVSANMVSTLSDGRMVLNFRGLQWLGRQALRYPTYGRAIGQYIEALLTGEAAPGSAIFLDAGMVLTLAFTAALLTGKYVLPEVVANLVPGLWGQWQNGPPPLTDALTASAQSIAANAAAAGNSCSACVSAVLSSLPSNSILNPIVAGCNAADPNSLDAINCAQYVGSINQILSACSANTAANGLYYASIGSQPDPYLTTQQVCLTPAPVAAPVAGTTPLSCPVTGNSSTGATKYLYFADVCDPNNQQQMIAGEVYCDIRYNLNCTAYDLTTVCSCAQQACNVATQVGQAFCAGNTSLLKQAYYQSSYCDQVLAGYYGGYLGGPSYGQICLPPGQIPTGSCDPTQQRGIASSSCQQGSALPTLPPVNVQAISISVN
jgi:hypothetical protein